MLFYLSYHNYFTHGLSCPSPGYYGGICSLQFPQICYCEIVEGICLACKPGVPSHVKLIRESWNHIMDVKIQSIGLKYSKLVYHETLLDFTYRTYFLIFRRCLKRDGIVISSQELDPFLLI